MNRNERSSAMLWTVFALACFLATGCGSSAPQVYPVRGEVFFNGQPANGAAVHFHPLEKEKRSPAFATVKDDGSFQLSTHVTNDGAAAGDYVVTLTWNSEKKVENEIIIGPDRLGDRYSKPEKSNLKATIIAGENVLPRFDLKK